MCNLNQIAQGRLEYECENFFFGLGDIVTVSSREFIPIPSSSPFAVFISWQPTRTTVSLTPSSAESIRRTNKKILVDLSIKDGSIISNDAFVFVKQPILQTFSFPKRTGSSSKTMIIIECKVYEDLDAVTPEPVNDDIDDEAFENRCISDLTGGLAKLLTDEKFADVTLKCNDGILKAHKPILASRSDVFERMFYSKMLEAETNEVICKFNVCSMKAFLEYLYSGKLDKTKVTVLFEAADYYNVVNLKETCEEILMKKLNAENAIPGLILAHTFGRKKLKKHILEYIPKNCKAVVASKGFKSASQDSSEFMLEIAFLLIKAFAKR